MTRDTIDAIRKRGVDEWVARRAEAIAAEGSAFSGRDPLVGGRILAFEVEACFFDGSAQSVTEGFFDENDFPPWDTWLGYRSLEAGQPMCLLSWVPAKLVVLANRGVEAHFACAYRWTDTVVSNGAIVVT